MGNTQGWALSILDHLEMLLSELCFKFCKETAWVFRELQRLWNHELTGFREIGIISQEPPNSFPEAYVSSQD